MSLTTIPPLYLDEFGNSRESERLKPTGFCCLRYKALSHLHKMENF